ncbi:AAA family ATPase [Pedobacter montanisoli]|uniref:ATP-binding protein n=1 Tax=Pedobacter montanisoli TaxID=2923277 RepID=A0ABS9ZTQ1_9SPHI|nr:ATP-binding protein [Pedobacter montanisoli]MCJ0741888.1 ATP-binding protein [Pedobacter montanisoli]
MNRKIKKIAVVGPESTGKSTMAKQLSKYYNVPWVPEYARYYCANLTEACTLQDEVNMFYGQVALEDSVVENMEGDFLICDTTFVTVKIWSDAFFGQTPEVVLEALKQREYDFYVLLDIDLPWEDDPLRDFPNQREHFMQVWHDELKALNANYKLVSGVGEQRLDNAIKVIDEFLLSKI